jgi:hypothetical protein
VPIVGNITVSNKPQPALWPIDTQAQREAVICRAIRDHIAKVEGRAKHTVTTQDVHDRVRYFGMSHSDVGDAVAVCVGMERPAGHD